MLIYLSAHFCKPIYTHIARLKAELTDKGLWVHTSAPFKKYLILLACYLALSVDFDLTSVMTWYF